MKKFNTLFFLSLIFSGCYQKSLGPKGSISQNGTGGFWKLESCEVKGQSVDISQFPDKLLLETQQRVVSTASEAPNYLFTEGMDYHVFSFYDQAVVLRDSFPAILWDFDFSKKKIEDSQWFKLTNDAGLLVKLDVEPEIGLTKKIQISNIMKSSSYRADLDTVHFFYNPIEKFK